MWCLIGSVGRMRAAVVIVEDDEVALIERVVAGGLYYLFPGGLVEPGETPGHAAAREAREELGLEVDVGRLVAVVEFRGKKQRYYLASVAGGEFGMGVGEELGFNADSPSGSYTPVWLPLDELATLDVRPRDVARLVCSGGLAFLEEPLRIVELAGEIGGGP